MIEHDKKTIKKRQKVSRTKTSQELKTIDKRLSKHDKQFSAIMDAIALLPTEQGTIDTIKTTVNGKIDGIKVDVKNVTDKVDMVGEHLKKQDDVAASAAEVAQEQGTAIQELSKKVAPIDQTREWLNDAGKIVLYLGSIALAIEAAIQILQFLNIIK